MSRYKCSIWEETGFHPDKIWALHSILLLLSLLLCSAGAAKEFYSDDTYEFIFNSNYNDSYTYEWSASSGSYQENGKNTFDWTAPSVNSPTEVAISVLVTDKACGCDSKFDLAITVLPHKTPINDTPINDTPINDTPINDTPINDTTINDTTINDTTINDTTINDTTINDTTIDDTTINDTAIDDTAINDTTINDTLINDTLINYTPINDTPINDIPINDITINDTTIEDIPANYTSKDDTLINTTPVNDIPVNDTSKDDTPIDTTPVNDIPVNDTPKDDIPIDDFSSDGSSLDDFGMTDNASSGEMALESTIPPENSEPEVEAEPEAEPVAEKEPNDEIWSIPLDFGEGITVEVIAVENSPNTFAASVESVEGVAGSLGEDVFQSPANLESNSTPLSQADNNRTTTEILNKTEYIESPTAQNATELAENQPLDQPGIDQKINDLASPEIASDASDEAGDQQDLDSVSLEQPAVEATPSNATMGTPAESEIPSA